MRRVLAIVLGLLLAFPALAQTRTGPLVIQNALGEIAANGAQATARANLGLPLGTSGATVPLLSGANTWSAAQTLGGAGTGLAVTNDATVGGNLTVTGTITGAGGSFLPLSGGTLTGPLTSAFSGAFSTLSSASNATVGGTLGVTGAATLGGNTSGANVLLNLNAAATGARKIQWQTAGVGRFDLGLTNGGEAGANAGSDFLLQRRSDAGAILDAPLTVTRATGLSTFLDGIYSNRGAVTLNGAITPDQQPFSSFVTYSGTNLVDTGVAYHSWLINSDAAVLLGTAVATGGLLSIKPQTGFTGSRIGLGSTMNLLGTSGNKAAGNNGVFNIALWGNVTASVSEGGTNLGSGAFGQTWAGLLNATLAAPATNYALFQGLEIDMNVLGTTQRKHGLQISLGPTDVNRGSLFDAAMIVGNSTTSAGSWKHGLLLGEDSSQWPFAADSTLIKAMMGQNDSVAPAVAALGLDVVDVTFGTAAFRTNGTSIDGSGNLQIGTGYLQPVADGLTIDTKGAVGSTASGAGMIVSGGSGWAGGEVLTDPYGGRYKVATVGAGVITALTVYRQPIFASTTTPANPVTLGVRSGTTSVAPTINISWNTTGNTLSLQPTGGTLKVGSTLMTANGAVATALSSIGPTGSHTTVQEWLTVTNAAGVIRYIPAF